MTVRRRASPVAGGSGAVVPGSEAQQCLQQLNPVHSGQQDGHLVQLRQPRGRQRLQRVSGETTEDVVEREAESGLRGLHRVRLSGGCHQEQPGKHHHPCPAG